MKNRLEMVTNIVVLIVALVVGFRFVAGPLFHRDFVPRKGQSVPQITGYRWEETPTLVLALKKGCHFCEESMPFYRRLLAMQQAGQLNARLMAVFPDGPAEVNDVIESQKLPIPAFPSIHLDTFRVNGTPTLILVDQKGRVVKPWIGKQDVAGENDIIHSLARSTTASNHPSLSLNPQ